MNKATRPKGSAKWSSHLHTFGEPKQTLPDYVVSTTIVKLDGTVVQLKRADDPKGFPLKVLHFGLLGVSAGENPGGSLELLQSLFQKNDIYGGDELPI